MKRKSLFTALAALVLVGTIVLPACQRDKAEDCFELENVVGITITDGDNGVKTLITDQDDLQWCISKLGTVKYSRKVNGGGEKSGFTWSITIEYADRAVVFTYKGDRLESNSSAYILCDGSAEILQEIITKYASQDS
ncbi:MAG: hypothetical protein IJE90_04245 [Clostridia bacterium]|nr:hypothetical protein [Clostridia bacterium]